MANGGWTNGNSTSRTRAIGYLRVSTDTQAEEGVSLAAQRSKLAAYADLYDIELVDIIVDSGASARSLKRDGLQKALRLLESGQADAILVAKLDRLTRSIRDLARLIDSYFGGGQFALLSVSENVDTRSASGRLVLNLLASISQWEREVIAERTREALAHKRANGEATGGDAPFGYSKTEDGLLIPDNEEQRTLDLITQLRERSNSIRTISSYLNMQGVAARGSRWHPTTIARLLRRTADSASSAA